MEKKIRINMMVNKSFWKEWRELAAQSNVSASSLFELVGSTIIKCQGPAFNVFDQVFELGKLEGIGKLKTKKKG